MRQIMTFTLLVIVGIMASLSPWQNGQAAAVETVPCGDFRPSVSVAADRMRGEIVARPRRTVIRALHRLARPPGLGVDSLRTTRENTVYELRDLEAGSWRLLENGTLLIRVNPLGDPGGKKITLRLPARSCRQLRKSRFRSALLATRGSFVKQRCAARPSGHDQWPAIQITRLRAIAFFGDDDALSDDPESGLELVPIETYGLNCLIPLE